MKKLITLLMLLALAVPAMALDSASDANKRTKDNEKQAALDEVPRLLAVVEQEIETSISNSLYYTVVRVNGYTDNAVTVVTHLLERKGYEVHLGRSGKHKEYKNLVISWEK